MSTQPETLELSAYSPMWPAVFDMECVRLDQIFGPGTVVIEHIGSTAIPGLAAKPIIDVMVGAGALEVFEIRTPELQAEGYRYVPEFEKSNPARRYFVKTDGQPGNFNLHAVVLGSVFWREHLAFRDALRANPALVEEYWRIKKRQVLRHPTDRTAYADAKATFIRSVLDAYL
jgi:GrpB-like predicted nucleotidyltransferase (UPF0157 family)